MSMRPLLWMVLLALGLLEAPALDAASLPVPGLTYSKGNESLSGKLVFQVWPDSSRESNSTNATDVFELNLTNGIVSLLFKAPKGLLIAGASGDAYCVLHWTGNGVMSDPIAGLNSRAYIYSKSLGLSRSIKLEREPDRTVLLSGHAFFEVRTRNGASLLDYDINRDQLQPVTLKGAKRWERENYKKIHAPRGMSNILHFSFMGYGKPFDEGTDYRIGVYSLDTLSGQIQWFERDTEDKDDPSHTQRAFDGRFIFFEGRDAPIHGSRLVSSARDYIREGERPPKAQDVRVLKNFSILSDIAGITRTLLGMSPDGRFALVKESESVAGNEGMPAGVHTYLIVEVTSGASWVLLKDDVQRKSGGFMSEVWWVQ